MTVRKNRSTPEGRAFWDAVAVAAKTVESWPPWKRGESTPVADLRAELAEQRATAERASHLPSRSVLPEER